MGALRLRNDLETTPRYVPGKRPSQSTGRPAAKLSSNENPYQPLPSVQAALLGAAEEINRYPGAAVAQLLELLAERHQVDPASIALGCGSVETISQVIRATCATGDEAIYAWRSFEAYPLLIAAAGAVGVPVPLDDSTRHDLVAMAAAVTDRTRCVLICTPNNPTGASVRSKELTHFLESVPDDITIVIDEAYVEFDRSEDLVDGVGFLRRHPNVAVARTFSKAYGLAGLRVGYVIGPTELTSVMRKVSLPFGVTDLAATAVIASIKAETELFERVQQLSRERDRVAGHLRAVGWSIPEANGNFIWFPLGDSTAEALAVFESHGLIVRPFLDEGIRVTIADPESNDRVLAAATELVQLGLAGDVDAFSNPTPANTP